MSATWSDAIWQQFGAAIDMLENAIVECPDQVWGNGPRDYWYLVYHTLFWLDFYLSDSPEEFRPPEPFGLEELDPSGVFPPRAYGKDEMRRYLRHGRDKCRTKLERLTDEAAASRYRFHRLDVSVAELLLYNLRHVQHGAAQLNLLLRQKTNSAPRWVGRAQSNATNG